jgi:hypothetical protein
MIDLTPQIDAKIEGLLRQLAQNEKLKTDRLAQMEQRHDSRLEIEQKARDHFAEITPHLVAIGKRISNGSYRSHANLENPDVLHLHLNHFTVTAQFQFLGRDNSGENPGLKIFTDVEKKDFEFDNYRSGWIQSGSRPSLETRALSEADIAGIMLDMLGALARKLS